MGDCDCTIKRVPGRYVVRSLVIIEYKTIVRAEFLFSNKPNGRSTRLLAGLCARAVFVETKITIRPKSSATMAPRFPKFFVFVYSRNTPLPRRSEFSFGLTSARHAVTFVDGR